MTTPREELEEILGLVSDGQWQFLKEFCQRNYIPNRGVDFEWDIDANLPVYTRDYLKLFGAEQQVFFYDDERDNMSSLTTYHAQELDVESLVEAHPDTIYFYATLTPS